MKKKYLGIIVLIVCVIVLGGCFKKEETNKIVEDTREPEVILKEAAENFLNYKNYTVKLQHSIANSNGQMSNYGWNLYDIENLIMATRENAKIDSQIMRYISKNDTMVYWLTDNKWYRYNYSLYTKNSFGWDNQHRDLIELISNAKSIEKNEKGYFITLDKKDVINKKIVTTLGSIYKPKKDITIKVDINYMNDDEKKEPYIYSLEVDLSNVLYDKSLKKYQYKSNDDESIQRWTFSEFNKTRISIPIDALNSEDKTQEFINSYN